MAQFIISTDLDPVSVQAFGNWFSFKPGQVKAMDPRLVDFLSMEKRYMGFVALPDAVGEDPGSAEAITAKEEAIKQGRANIAQHLQGLIHNLEVSVQSEYERLKEAVPSSVKKAHLPHYRKLAALKASTPDEDEAALDEIAKLKGQIDGDSNRAHAGPTDKGSKNLPKSA